jgi:hypothetical protein
MANLIPIMTAGKSTLKISSLNKDLVRIKEEEQTAEEILVAR